MTVTVNAVRSMMLEGAPGDLGQALIWIAGILIVFISLAVWAYKRSA